MNVAEATERRRAAEAEKLAAFQAKLAHRVSARERQQRKAAEARQRSLHALEESALAYLASTKSRKGESKANEASSTTRVGGGKRTGGLSTGKFPSRPQSPAPGARRGAPPPTNQQAFHASMHGLTPAKRDFNAGPLSSTGASIVEAQAANVSAAGAAAREALLSMSTRSGGNELGDMSVNEGFSTVLGTPAHGASGARANAGRPLTASTPRPFVVRVSSPSTSEEGPSEVLADSSESITGVSSELIADTAAATEAVAAAENGVYMNATSRSDALNLATIATTVASESELDTSGMDGMGDGASAGDNEDVNAGSLVTDQQGRRFQPKTREEATKLFLTIRRYEMGWERNRARARAAARAVREQKEAEEAAIAAAEEEEAVRAADALAQMTAAATVQMEGLMAEASGAKMTALMEERRGKERERYVDALRHRVKERLGEAADNLPSLCACGHASVWVDHAASCATNCAFYGDTTAYSRALVAMLENMALM